MTGFRLREVGSFVVDMSLFFLGTSVTCPLFRGNFKLLGCSTFDDRLFVFGMNTATKTISAVYSSAVR